MSGRRGENGSVLEKIETSPGRGTWMVSSTGLGTSRSMDRESVVGAIWETGADWSGLERLGAIYSRRWNAWASLWSIGEYAEALRSMGKMQVLRYIAVGGDAARMAGH
jgi:hypothetical protein